MEKSGRVKSNFQDDPISVQSNEEFIVNRQASLGLMRPVRLALLIAFLIIPLIPGGPSTASAQSGNAKTVWDGVYTDAQAMRGADVYSTHCSSCHGAELNGRNAPALKGTVFMDHWREDSLNSLFMRIKLTMPPGYPSGLSDTEYLDIVAHVLQVNSFPAGAEELKADSVQNIRVVGKDGPSPVPEFALVRVVGCLAQGTDKVWMLTNATEPVRTRNPDAPTATDLKISAAQPLGTQTFQLLYADFFRPGFHADSYNGHKMEAKGFLIRKPDSRLSITWLESVGSSCNTAEGIR
jgi:mono/diheme cytochrome c family protein